MDQASKAPNNFNLKPFKFEESSKNLKNIRRLEEQQISIKLKARDL